MRTSRCCLLSSSGILLLQSCRAAALQALLQLLQLLAPAVPVRGPTQPFTLYAT